MAVMSDADRNKAARILGRKLYNGTVANCNHADLLAAVMVIDDAMEAVPTGLPNQAQSIALNLNAILPDPFKATATQPQKATLLAVWAGVKYGLITTGGD